MIGRAIVVALLVGLSLGSARAQPDGRRAGIAALERLYDAKRDPDLLLELARLYEAAAGQGDPRDARLAILYYERYLAEKPAATEPGERVAIDRAPLDAALARLRAVSTGGARAAAARVPVSFTAYQGSERYDVTVGGLRCRTPCTLELPPGPALAHATGDGSVDLQLVVPHLPSQVRVQADSAKAYTIAGAILLPLGAVVAASFWTFALACHGSDNGCVLANLSVWPILGGTSFFTGVGLLAYGTTHRAPIDANRPEILESRRTPRWRLAGVGIAPSPTGASAGARFSF